jgi:hypothetical protein
VIASVRHHHPVKMKKLHLWYTSTHQCSRVFIAYRDAARQMIKREKAGVL